MSNTNRLIIDCSHAYRRGQHAGVQRVVWNLIEQAMVTSSVNAEVTLVNDGQFWPYDPAQPLKSSRMRQDVVSCLPGWYRKAAEWLVSKTSSAKLKRWLLPVPGKLGLFRLWHSWQERRDLQRLRGSSQWRKPGRSDVLLMADGYWCRKQVWPAVEEARRRGAKVVTILYDLIPLTHPHFVRPGGQEAFEEYFESVIKHSDTIMAISRFVADECRAEIEQRWPERLRELRIDHFRLGADLPNAEGNVRPEIRQLFGDRNQVTPYLMVSTFDPRKNHAMLLRCFERVWQRYPDARLCLVGSTGWMSEKLMSEIEGHPRYQKQLFKFHGLDDVQLKYCYQHARGVLCPSLTEGFGLSVVEALAHGRRTFVSDIAVHREVGGNDCHYFQPDDAEQLAAMIGHWEVMIAAGAAPKQPVRMPTTWQESACDLFAKCIDASGIHVCDAQARSSYSKSA